MEHTKYEPHRKYLRRFRFREDYIDRINNLVELKEAIGRYTGQDMDSKRRFRGLVEAKRLYCKIALDRHRSILTLSDIAGVIGVHHATVLHHAKLFEDLISYDKSIEKSYKYITSLNPYRHVMLQGEKDRIMFELDIAGYVDGNED